MDWSDPSLVRLGRFHLRQKYWRHNFCRKSFFATDSALNHMRRPWCMINATAYQECDVSTCTFTEIGEKWLVSGKAEMLTSPFSRFFALVTALLFSFPWR